MDSFWNKTFMIRITKRRLNVVSINLINTVENTVLMLSDGYLSH